MNYRGNLAWCRKEITRVQEDKEALEARGRKTFEDEERWWECLSDLTALAHMVGFYERRVRAEEEYRKRPSGVGGA